MCLISPTYARLRSMYRTLNILRKLEGVFGKETSNRQGNCWKNICKEKRWTVYSRSFRKI